MPPPRPRLSTTERLRLFDLHGRTCHVCNRPILFARWEIDHVQARGLIGPDADTDDNMRPVHVRCHRDKTVMDIDAIAEAKRRYARHVGAHRSSRPLPFGQGDRLKRKIGGRIVLRHPEERPHG